jgi:hypothetical protein
MSTTTDYKIVLDNRCNVSDESTGLVRLGGQNVLQLSVPADGQSYANQIQFNNIVVPNYQTTLLSRNIRVVYNMRVCYPSAAGNAPLQLPLPASNDSYQVNAALRAFPLQSCTDSLSLVINGSTNTINSRQVLSALARRIPKDYLRNQASEAPVMPDDRAILVSDAVPLVGSWSLGAYPAAGQVVNVGFNNGLVGSFTTDAAYPAAGAKIPVTIPGYNYNAYWVAGAAFVQNAVNQVSVDQPSVSFQPLSKYENCDGTSRASFKALSYGNGVPVEGLQGPQNVWLYEVSEPLLISPLTLHDEETFLANINTLSCQINFSLLSDAVVASGILI